jgi:cell division protein FtsW
MHLVAIALPFFPVVILIMRMKSYQWQRVSSWWVGIWNPLDAAYQVKQSMIGLGRGGISGVGIGESKQKFFFLPDSHTDFIFSIIGEEFGFIGATLVLMLFMVILFRGMRLAKLTRDPFGQLLAAGITINIVLYALINTAVVTNMVPATGLPMPFISYGGSHMIFLGVSVGILLNISRHAGSQSWEDFQQKRFALAKTMVESN